jgi:hypothetical protein
MLLNLKDRSDPITEIVAQLIIEVAQTGEQDPQIICMRALRRLHKTNRAAS